MSPHRKRTSPTRINWLIVLIFAVVIIGAFFALSSFGPRSVTASSEDRVTDEVALGFLEQSKEREEEFDALLIGGVIDRDDMEVLSRAINLQEEYIAALPARDFIAENRLEQLERRYSEYMGEILSREAELLESKARAMDDSRERLFLLREAIGIREDIRDRYGSSASNDLSYLSRLQREMQTLEIQPVYDRSLELEAEGDALAEKGDLDGAVSKFGDALRLQEEINRNHPDLVLAKPLRASRLREKESAVLSGEFRRQIDELIGVANDLVYEKKYEEAATAFSRAREMQRNLNLEYPRSPFASRGREERLRVRMQNASAFSSYERLRDLEGLLNRSLREENLNEARLLVEQLSDRIDQFELRYSLSTLPISDLSDRISYLSRKKRILEEIQSSVESDLLPVPGESGVGLFASEVPQFLFELVMDANPSRNKSMDSPVETASLVEVELFLQRVGWVLAKETRLPTVKEFRLAAQAAAQTEDLLILSSGSGANEPRPVQSLSADTNGFFHLLGNVSEIVTLSSEEGDIAHIGGNLRTIRNQILELEPVVIEPGERNRMVGFRFIVEDTPLALSLTPDPEI